MVLRLKLRNLGTHSLTFHQIKHSHVTTTYPLGGLEVWCSHVPRNGIFFMDDQLLPCLYNVLSHFSGKTTTRFCCPWDFPGKNTGVGCRALLQGIFLTPGCRQVLYHQCSLESPLPPLAYRQISYMKGLSKTSAIIFQRQVQLLTSQNRKQNLQVQTRTRAKGATLKDIIC